VCASLELEGIADIKIDHIPTLRGMYSALKNGKATVEEMFPLPKGVDQKKEAASAKATPTPPSPDGEPKMNGAAVVATAKSPPTPPTPPA
jgi:hypothetical protein